MTDRSSAPIDLFETHRGNYTISTDPGRLDLAVIHGYLDRSYWAAGRPRELVARSLPHSLCFGLYRGDAQVGLARVVSDYATFAWLADVFVLEEHRGQGLAKWLIASVVAHPDLRELRRFMLATRDAHGLYRQFGFAPIAAPERLLARVADPLSPSAEGRP